MQKKFNSYNKIMAKILKRDFYSEETTEVARNMLGKVLCREINGAIYRGLIVETEAYTQDEPSCHAYNGITKRSKTLFEKPGLAYVYMTYGMYHCLNITTEREGFGASALIRAIEPLSANFTNTNGPAKMCRELNITRELNGVDVTNRQSGLWLEEGTAVEAENIVQTTRIGIKLAAELPWRFYIKDNKWVSKK